MDFRYKCALQHVFSRVPFGRHMNHFMQRHVTKNLPISDSKLDQFRGYARRHIESYRKVRGTMPLDAFEFGSGWDLAIAISMGLTGVKTIASDIGKYASTSLVTDILARSGVQTLDQAGVRYVAPYQFGTINRYFRPRRAEKIEVESFDLITSTSVLEHVPEEGFANLLVDCMNLLRPNGILSFWIDYKDHWSYFDKSITPFNFYRFSDDEWRKYNPSLQFQNRLRHSDYVQSFDGYFRILEADIEREPMPDIPLAERFLRYTKDDLETTGAWFVLEKRNKDVWRKH